LYPSRGIGQPAARRSGLDCPESPGARRERRYGTPAELRRTYGAILNHEAVLARPPEHGLSGSQVHSTHRMAVSVAAGLLVLLAAFSVLQDSSCGAPRNNATPRHAHYGIQ